MSNNRIIVTGNKRSGAKFRPSDWIDRLASSFAVYTSTRRLRWHKGIQPIYVDSEKCLAIDTELASSHPEIWSHVLGFVKANELQILGSDRRPTSCDQLDRSSQAA